MSRSAAVAWSEARFWGRLLTRFLSRHPGFVVVASALCWFWGMESLWLVLPLLGVAVGLRVWAVGRPISFSKFIAGPYLGWLRRRRVRQLWPEVCAACDLGPSPSGLLRIRSRWPRIVVRTHPAIGQTFADFEKAGEAIRTAFGAAQIRVEPLGASDVSVALTFGDGLAVPFEAVVPVQRFAEIEYVVMGRRSDGAEWRLPIGPHTLVAGSSGSGKGSVFWSLAFGLAPEVRAGRVQLHGVDLKGGMEILMGGGLFSTRATSAAEAVAGLELLVGWMRQRTSQYAGRLRSHAASVEEPLHVVMIDELAALTAYCPERDLQRRAENAINLLCSQGRAPGFMVFACLQDPRKEVIPSRGLFTQMVGLRLKDMSETAMVLGEVAVESGAHCHRITRDVPGTGYVIPEDGGHPIRVRAGYASDDKIRAVAAEFATPVSVPTLVLQSGDDLGTRGHRPRSTGAA
jgi:S-DNA-T family DNA segregation ATPase FtsK/SpoIIIE